MRKFQIPTIKNLDLDQKTWIQALFHVDLTKFWVNLAKSHQIRWDYHRIWRNLIDSDEIFARSGFFFTFSLSFLAFFCRFLRSDSDRPVRVPIEVWSAQPVYSGGQRHVSFFKTWFSQVNSRLGTNPTQTDLWTALVQCIKAWLWGLHLGLYYIVRKSGASLPFYFYFL